MPAKIQTVEDLMNSRRFKNETHGRSYTQDEKIELGLLFDYIKENDSLLKSGTYSIMIKLVSYEVENLVERFKFLKDNKSRNTKETVIARYGVVEGIRRWNEYTSKQAESNSFEYKKKKYGWSEKEFSDFNKSRSITKELMVKRYGKTDGLAKWNEYIEKQRYTNSLEYFQEKFGKEVGKERWISYNNEKGKSGKLEWIMEKYDVDEEVALSIASSRHPKSHSSQAELTFVNDIESALGEEIKYSAKTNQFSLWNHYSNTINFYDLVDTDRNKIIEFHGDYWHCNPKRYSSEFIHSHSGLTAKQIWEKDYLKIKTALDRGFQVKIVWWSDYEQNREKIIQECKEWILK